MLLIRPPGLPIVRPAFGVPHLLSLASAITSRTSAQVDVADLAFERASHPIDFDELLQPPPLVVGVSAYSSFQFLAAMGVAARVRASCPDAWLVAGGHHATDRPADFLVRHSPFDFVVVGEGEAPMVDLVLAAEQQHSPSQRVLGPGAAVLPDQMREYDWTLLDRVRMRARQVRAHVEISLSRAADAAWRALDPDRAVAELHRLDSFLDLSSLTLVIVDPVFGAESSWRKEFLARLGQAPTRANTTWVSPRLDLVDEDDIERMHRCRLAPQFWLRTGVEHDLDSSPDVPSVTRAEPRLRDIVRWTRAHQVPFRLRVSVGGPGETPESVAKSARALHQILLDSNRTTGLLSVASFRLFPGTHTDEALPRWTHELGMRMHRYPWWHDTDQDFLSLWLDPSASLDFRTLHASRRTLLDPIEHALDPQAKAISARRTLRLLGLWHDWSRRTRASDAATLPGVLEDTELAAVARDAREQTLQRKNVQASEAVRDALVQTPRERFVRLEDVAASAEDKALALTDDATSTISALHSYAHVFDALELRAGDRLVDLGGGTGYGAALASRIVGPSGHVLMIEWREDLVARARGLLAGHANVTVVSGDAHDVSTWAGARKVTVGFAVVDVPHAWIDALQMCGVMVVPVGDATEQQLLRIEKTRDGVISQALRDVRFVRDRSKPIDPTDSNTRAE